MGAPGKDIESWHTGKRGSDYYLDGFKPIPSLLYVIRPPVHPVADQVKKAGDLGPRSGKGPPLNLAQCSLINRPRTRLVAIKKTLDGLAQGVKQPLGKPSIWIIFDQTRPDIRSLDNKNSLITPHYP